MKRTADGLHIPGLICVRFRPIDFRFQCLVSVVCLRIKERVVFSCRSNPGSVYIVCKPFDKTLKEIEIPITSSVLKNFLGQYNAVVTCKIT